MAWFPGPTELEKCSSGSGARVGGGLALSNAFPMWTWGLVQMLAQVWFNWKAVHKQSKLQAHFFLTGIMVIPMLGTALASSFRATLSWETPFSSSNYGLLVPFWQWSILLSLSGSGLCSRVSSWPGLSFLTVWHTADKFTQVSSGPETSLSPCL